MFSHSPGHAPCFNSHEGEKNKYQNPQGNAIVSKGFEIMLLHVADEKTHRQNGNNKSTEAGHKQNHGLNGLGLIIEPK